MLRGPTLWSLSRGLGLALLTGSLSALLACSSPEPRPAPLIVPTTPLSSLYVSPNGDDNGSGQMDSPFKTIERAAAAATPGTTIVVADGTYVGSLETRASGRSDARIAFTAANKGRAKIVVDGDGSESAWTNRGDYVDIVGFDISGDNGAEGSGLSNYGSYVRIASNQVHGFSHGNCIFTGSDDYSLHDIDVVGNVAFGCGEDGKDHGIYLGHTGGNVSNNISYGNSGFGIHCWHNCNKMTIANNLLFENREGGIILGQGDGPNFGEVNADDCLVVNNIVLDNKGNGISEYGATGNNNKFISNNVWNNDARGMRLQSGQEIDTLNVDPGFIKFEPDGSGDYRLAPSSPNRNAGTKAGAPPTDIVGVSRYRDSGVDIGVYEN